MALTTRYVATITVLKKALHKIENKENWCRFGLAQRADGSAVDPDDLEAVRWSAAGALLAVEHNCLKEPLFLLEMSCPHPKEGFEGISPITYVNGVLGHKAVIAMFKEAIAREKIGLGY